MPFNHLIHCCLLFLLPSIFPSIRVFSNKSVIFTSGGQSIGISASASVLPMDIQDWFPLGWTGWISLLPGTLQESSPTRILYQLIYQGSPTRAIIYVKTCIMGTDLLYAWLQYIFPSLIFPGKTLSSLPMCSFSMSFSKLTQILWLEWERKYHLYSCWASNETNELSQLSD